MRRALAMAEAGSGGRGGGGGAGGRNVCREVFERLLADGHVEAVGASGSRLTSLGSPPGDPLVPASLSLSLSPLVPSPRGDGFVWVEVEWLRVGWFPEWLGNARVRGGNRGIRVGSCADSA